MQLIISARHTEVTDHLRQLVEEQFARLKRYEPKVLRVEVTLLEEKNRCEVEAQANVARAASVHAHGEAPDFRTAVDQVVDRLSRQLKKNHSRRRDHQAPPKESLLMDEPQS